MQGKSEKQIKEIKLRYNKNLKNLKFKKKFFQKINFDLITDNSSMTWGENDNYKSINSQTFQENSLILKLLI